MPVVGLTTLALAIASSLRLDQGYRAYWPGLPPRCSSSTDRDAGLLAGHNFLVAIVPAIGNSLDGLRTNRCASPLGHVK